CTNPVVRIIRDEWPGLSTTVTHKPMMIIRRTIDEVAEHFFTHFSGDGLKSIHPLGECGEFLRGSWCRDIRGG
ncbi:MAG: hypothetical protein IPN60_19950, partial [Saprospiraceae bacterium]|nr:hypothetical protein [Candidatus Opimibacter skivensis]